MDYRFTAILIIMMTLLALFGGPAHSRNEYLNEYLMKDVVKLKQELLKV